MEAQDPPSAKNPRPFDGRCDVLYNTRGPDGAPPAPAGPCAPRWVPATAGRPGEKIPPLATWSLFLQAVTPAISLASRGSASWHTAAEARWKNHKADGSFTFFV